ncbi:MAG: N-acetylmuramoyl-L-alanine amidase [Butyricicoccus sp.]|nr:N-acetylmuramoyl-L-alanine amidase [Butyricicoccus sp.]
MNIRTKRCNAANHGGRRTQPIEYLVIHYTSNRGDTAKNNADFFAREITRTSAHYFVDENEIWQSVPDDTVAWHCGGSRYVHADCRNANAIGIEVCMQDRQGKLRQASIDRAARLAPALMDRYGIPVERVLRHYDVTHKNCPAPMVEDPARWEDFRKELNAMKDIPASWAKEAWEKASAAQVVDGTRPTEAVTRQELAVILDRLGLVK